MKSLLISSMTMLWGFSAGMVLGTAMASFITIIGIIPRIAVKLKITKHYFMLATAMVLGTTVGSYLEVWKPSWHIPAIIISLFSFAFGIFIGCLTIAIAEVLDVMPIMNRRMHLKRSFCIFIILFALGKMIGAFYYWLYPGFTRLLD